MVVISDPKSFSGIFSGNKLTIQINFLDIKDIKVKVNNKNLTIDVDYTAIGDSTYKDKVPKVYSQIHITFPKNYVKALYEISNDIQFTQQIDYSRLLTADTTQLEYSFDKNTIEMQSISAKIDKDANILENFPNLDFQAYGSAIVTSGKGTLDLFPVRLTEPNKDDDGKLLGIDLSTKRIKYIDPTGSENPAIPQPQSNYKPLVSHNSSYKLGVEEPILDENDSGKVLVFDGSKFIAKNATGISNPSIPVPSDKGLVLISKNNNGQIVTDWSPNQAINTSASSGVISGLKITINTSTSINISSGLIQIVDDSVNSNPTIELVSIPTYNDVSIPTTNGTITYLYINVSTDGNISIILQSTFVELARGRKIFIADIAHSYNNKITNISIDYTLITSIPYQLKTIMQDTIGNIARSVQLKPKSNTTDQLVYSLGVFHGYNCNVNKNSASPHISNIDASSLVSFRWRTLLGKDTESLTHIDSSTLKYEISKGVLVSLGTGKWTTVLVWIYPSGDVIFQYGNEQADTKLELTPVDIFVKSIPKDPNMLKHAAPIGVLKLKEGGNFATDHEVVNLVDFNVGGSGTSGLGLPIVSQTDENKLLVVSSIGTWVPSTYNLPVPKHTDEGKVLTVVGNSYETKEIPEQEDNIGRTWFTSGVLNGITPITINGDKINIQSGNVCFMDDNDGEPNNFKVVQFVGVVDYKIDKLTTTKETYISINSSGILIQTELEPTKSRGNIALLCLVDHSNNTTIDQIIYLFNVQNAIPTQIKELWYAVGSQIDGLEMSSSGTNEFKHASGIFKGFNVGVGTGEFLRDPHKKTLAPLNQIPFEFRDSATNDSSTDTTFPSIPKVELTDGVLTDLTPDHISFYPVWLFDTNRLIIQYATKEYSSSEKIPTPPELALLFRPNTKAKRYGVFVGFVQWEVGKDFTSGNKFIPFNLLGGVASTGGSGLPEATPNDKDRVYSVDDKGLSSLGVKIQRPKSGEIFTDRIVTTNQDGDILFTDPSTTPTKLGGLPTGDFFLVSRNGIISAITNRTPYVQSSGIPAEDSHLYSVRPAPIEFTHKGVFLSKFSLNNYGGGGGSKKLKLSDVWKRLTGTGSTDKFFRGVKSNDEPTQDRWDKLNSRFTDPASDSELLKFITPIENEIKIFANKDGELTRFAIVDEIIANQDYTRKNSFRSISFGSDISLNNPSVEQIDFSLPITSGVNQHVGYSAHHFPGVNYISFHIPRDPELTIEIEILSLESTVVNYMSPFSTNCHILTSSSTPIKGDYNLKIPISYSSGTKKTNINLKTIVNGIDSNISSPPNLYHRPNVAATDNLFYIGLSTPIDYLSGEFSEEAMFYIKLNVRLKLQHNGTEGAFFINESRYEYITLKQIRDLVGLSTTDPIPSTGFNHIFNGVVPTIKPGKITVFLWILFPKDIKKLSDYDQSHGGLVINEFDRNDVPMCFLEEQSGSNKYTNRLEGKRRFAKSRLVESYDFDCTQDQFDNWKLVFYFRTKISEVSFKKNADELGGSVWIVNTEDIPE